MNGGQHLKRLNVEWPIFRNLKILYITITILLFEISFSIFYFRIYFFILSYFYLRIYFFIFSYFYLRIYFFIFLFANLFFYFFIFYNNSNIQNVWIFQIWNFLNFLSFPNWWSLKIWELAYFLNSKFTKFSGSSKLVNYENSRIFEILKFEELAYF